MLQVLIVDDEASVADSLEMALPWQELNIEGVYKAYSAREALELLNRCSVDIVLTDIRMPEMSGIELSRMIRSRWKETSVVFLTGYSDFEYARHAVEIQASDFILKPFRNERVVEALKKIIARKEEEWQARHSLDNALYALRDSLPLLRSTLLNDILIGRRVPEEPLARKLEMLQLPFRSGDSCGMALIRLEGGFSALGSAEMALMEYSVTNIAEELLQPYFRVWACKDAHDYLVLLVRPETQVIESALSAKATPAFLQQLLEKLAAEVKTSVRNYLKGGLSVLLGPWSRFPEDTGAAYAHSLSCFRNRIGKEQELLFTYQDPPAEDAAGRSLQALYRPPTLNQLLETGKWEEARSKVEDILRETSRLQSGEYLLEAFWGIAASYMYISHKNGRQLTELLSAPDQTGVHAGGRPGPGLPAGGYPRTQKQLEDWAKDALKRLEAEMERENRDSRSVMIQQVQGYVERMLDKDISLQAISDHVQLNPSYLSRIYKLETGESISDYIYGLRMDKAAYYLRSTELKIYEITGLLGYQYTPYFIKVFKQRFGVTPQEYRDGKGPAV